MESKIYEAVKKTNLQYLWDLKGEAFTLREGSRADTHGSLVGGEFLRCIVGAVELPAGTEGVLFKMPQYFYSEYKWIGDEQYPAAGADILVKKTFYQFATMVKLADGTEVLADAFKTVELPAAKVVGKVGR
jgi:hypothetical protein